MPRIEPLPEPTPSDREAILTILNEANREHDLVWEPRPLVLVLRGSGNEILGGLIGKLHWGWLRIDILAVVASLRGSGWGRRLVHEAERLAIAAGCQRAWVDTFSFQAPGFYERLGYRVFGELPNYPSGQVRIFLAKVLVEEDRDPAGITNS